MLSLWTTSGPSSSYVSCEITVFMKESLHPQPSDVRSTVATQTASKNEKKTRVYNALESVKQPKKKMFVTRIPELGYWDLCVRRNVGRGRSQLNSVY